MAVVVMSNGDWQGFCLSVCRMLVVPTVHVMLSREPLGGGGLCDGVGGAMGGGGLCDGDGGAMGGGRLCDH